MNIKPAIYSAHLLPDVRTGCRQRVRHGLASAAAAQGSPPQGPFDPAQSDSTAPVTEKLIWFDEFNGPEAQSAPDATKWTYDTGAGHWGNRELETYCAYGSDAPPCNAKSPNVYVGSDGFLHIVARRAANGAYISARIKIKGLASFQYGRMEARIQISAGPGMWPAFWMLGDSIESVGWPKCGEFDIMENIGKEPATVHSSIHGQGFTGTSMRLPYANSGNVPFSRGFHTFGLIWSPGKVMYYVDSPSNVYATFTPLSLPAGAVCSTAAILFYLELGCGWRKAWCSQRRNPFPC